MVSQSETSNGSVTEFWVTCPPYIFYIIVYNTVKIMKSYKIRTSTNIFSTTMFLITAEYRHDRSPNPRLVSQTQFIPIPRVNAKPPSGMSLTFVKLPGFKRFSSLIFSSTSPW